MKVEEKKDQLKMVMQPNTNPYRLDLTVRFFMYRPKKNPGHVDDHGRILQLSPMSIKGLLPFTSRAPSRGPRTITRAPFDPRVASRLARFAEPEMILLRRFFALLLFIH
jgi:hypothetical protein